MKAFFMGLLILSQFLLNAHAAECELYSGFNMKAEICWNDEHKAFVSKNCLPNSCDALMDMKFRFPANHPSKRINLSTLACVKAGATIVVLKDHDRDELSFCQFPDGSLRDVSSVELQLP
jgi:putative hemolysin